MLKREVSSIVACCVALWDTTNTIKNKHDLEQAIDTELSRILLIPSIHAIINKSVPASELQEHPWKRRLSSRQIIDRLQRDINEDEVALCRDVSCLYDISIISIIRRGLKPVSDKRIKSICRAVEERFCSDPVYEQTSDMYNGIFECIVTSGHV